VGIIVLVDSLEVDTDLEVDLGSLVVVLMVDINLVVGIVLVEDIDLMVVLDSLVVDLVVDISLEEDTGLVVDLDNLVEDIGLKVGLKVDTVVVALLDIPMVRHKVVAAYVPISFELVLESKLSEQLLELMPGLERQPALLELKQPSEQLIVERQLLFID
tara:strand:- start:582 stop:1058 length:477 start_codon:yes stop_codon:yes gene_type:complete